MSTCMNPNLSFPKGEPFQWGGCYGKYACRKGAFLPEEGNTLSPWVKCVFDNGEGHLITVGNQSSPEIQNSAVIKSFDIGTSDGMQCKIVIHDTQGSAFDIFVKNLVKDFRKLNTNEGFRLTADWGWVKTGCPTAPASSSSCTHYLHVDSIESSFVAGKFIHEVTATDLLVKAFEGGVEKQYGEDGKELPLKVAIENLFTKDPAPKIKEVKFMRMENGKLVPYKFKGAEEDKKGNNGPLGKFQGKGRNKLDTAMSWIKTTTENGKGVKPIFDGTIKGGRLVFLEDPKPKCDEVKNWESNCIGTYVVNAGKNSSVLEFNPRIRWDFSRLMNVGGNHPENTVEDTPQQKVTGLSDCDELTQPGTPGAGQVSTMSTSENEKNRLGRNATSSVAKAEAAQMRTMRVIPDVIDADLVVMGDPSLSSAVLLTGMNVSIVFINPFHLLPDGSACGDWTVGVDNICNPILSNKAWFITEVKHHIQEGVYTTTLGISLAAPGIDIEPGSNFGGSAEGAKGD
jgi:hypothetical protein